MGAGDRHWAASFKFASTTCAPRTERHIQLPLDQHWTHQTNPADRLRMSVRPAQNQRFIDQAK
jgi:hypothetical protein